MPIITARTNRQIDKARKMQERPEPTGWNPRTQQGPRPPSGMKLLDRLIATTERYSTELEKEHRLVARFGQTSATQRNRCDRSHAEWMASIADLRAWIAERE